MFDTNNSKFEGTSFIAGLYEAGSQDYLAKQAADYANLVADKTTTPDLHGAVEAAFMAGTQAYKSMWTAFQTGKLRQQDVDHIKEMATVAKEGGRIIVKRRDPDKVTNDKAPTYSLIYHTPEKIAQTEAKRGQFNGSRN